MKKKSAANITTFPGVRVNGVTRVDENRIGFLIDKGVCLLDSKVNPFQKKAIQLGLKMSGYAVRVQM